jgi:hypothetical protein
MSDRRERFDIAGLMQSRKERKSLGKEIVKENEIVESKRSQLRSLKAKVRKYDSKVSLLNSFSAGPYKRRTCTVYGMVYDFADSYLRFGACYVDENTTIRFSETISPNSYR